MKKELAAAVVLLALASRGAGAAPIGLDVELEAGAGGLSDPEEFELYLGPEVRYALGATGFRLGLAWQVPVLPEAGSGEIEAWQEYETVLPGLALVAGNSSTFSLQPFEAEGYLYLIAGHGFRDLAVELELDLGYAPEFLLAAIPGLAWEREIGPGALAIGVEQNLDLAPQPEWGDTEFFVSYEIPVRGIVIAFEVDPTLTADGGFSLSALVTFGRSF